jgi:hypothetical protein
MISQPVHSLIWRVCGEFGDHGDSAFNSSRSFIEIVRRFVSDGLHRKNAGCRRRWRIPKWRAAIDESGHYSFAVPL